MLPCQDEGRARRHKYPRAPRLPPPTPPHAPSRHPVTPAPENPLTTTAAQGDPSPPPLLGPLLGSLPDLVFQQEVLKRLGPRDLASLAGAGRGCAAAVAATALMQWAKRTKRTACGPLPLPPLCLKEACSHAASGGHREVLEWLHNNGCPWDAKTCAVAAGGGHLVVLSWARGTAARGMR